MLNELAYTQGINDGMAKFAISRFRQYARDVTQQAWNSQQPADIAKARSAVQGAYKPRVLGKGAEGTATLQMMPQADAGGALTPTVRKEFDTKARLASPELIQRRVALGPALNATGDFAKFYGHGQTAAGKPYIDSEYIPGKIKPGTDVSKAQANIDRSLRSEGMKAGLGHLAAKDIRAENLGVNPKTKKTVALDYMPMKRQEVYDPRYARMTGSEDTTRLYPTGKGAPIFPNSAKDFADHNGTEQKMHTKDMAALMKANPQSVLPQKTQNHSIAPAAPAVPGTVAARPALMPTAQKPAGPPIPGPSVFGSL
jgi:hypothetical protein